MRSLCCFDRISLAEAVELCFPLKIRFLWIKPRVSSCHSAAVSTPAVYLLHIFLWLDYCCGNNILDVWQYKGYADSRCVKSEDGFSRLHLVDQVWFWNYWGKQQNVWRPRLLQEVLYEIFSIICCWVRLQHGPGAKQQIQWAVPGPRGPKGHSCSHWTVPSVHIISLWNLTRWHRQSEVVIWECLWPFSGV